MSHREILEQAASSFDEAKSEYVLINLHEENGESKVYTHRRNLTAKGAILMYRSCLQLIEGFKKEFIQNFGEANAERLIEDLILRDDNFLEKDEA